MTDQNVQVIAVVSQDEATTTPPDIEKLLTQHLRKKYDFQRERFQTALLYSTLATMGVIIALIVSSAFNLFNINPLPETYRLFAPFVEWGIVGAEYDICRWDCEIGVQSTRLVKAVQYIGASIVSAEDWQWNVAGIARLCTLVSVSFAVWFAYRKKLEQYYMINAHQAQLEDFKTTPRWQFWLSRVCYMLATLFGTYVVVSILWLGVSVMFRNMTLRWFEAAIIIVAFTGTITFAGAWGALAASTRDVLLLGLFTFVFGFSASFALAPATQVDGIGFEWWQGAVSNVGQFNPSAALFTGTLLSGSLALVVMWFDLNSIIQKMINDGAIRFLSARAWMGVAGLLYALLVIGLLGVGFIRVDRENFPENTLFHAGGAVLSIASVVVSGLLIRKHRFHPWYQIFSVHILLGVTLIMAFLGSFRIDPPSFVFPGTGIISLTVIELSLLLLIGLWTYVTVDNLLGQADVHAFEGEVIVVRQR